MSETNQEGQEDHHHGGLGALTIGALGVVFGDIGTSPLYAVREALAHNVPVNEANILGVLSLVFWALAIVICLKYLGFIMRADLHGEGGILALTAQVSRSRAKALPIYPVLLALGLIGTSLLYGDGMITPAISVLSAVEGLEVIQPAFKSLVLPITILILVGLFSAQSYGTEKVGAVFGPVMLLWFGTLAAMGLYHVGDNLVVLKAANPLYAIDFVRLHQFGAFIVMGSVFLAVTGGEAVYADMGHFGRKPIRMAWFFLVWPALLLNYAGQGAFLLKHPEAVHNPFYKMVPNIPYALTAVVLLATCATVIASQALISGAFSLTMQAVQLGFVPRQKVLQTSPKAKGQIYVPTVNWILMIACIILVIGFRSSTNLAAAYGIAVTTTMVIDTILFCFLATCGWNWPVWKSALLGLTFISLESLFFASNVLKIPDGGWLPLLVGATIYLAMATWMRGRDILRQEIQKRSLAFSDLVAQLESREITRIPGTAVFMFGAPEGTPPALWSNVKHNHVLHERVVFVAVRIENRPYLFASQRGTVESLGHGFHRVTLRFGFMDRLDVPWELSRVTLEGGEKVPEDASYFLGKESLIPRQEKFSGMPHWREQLFATMSRNAQDATAFFHLPPDRVIELGTQVEI
jgi:KUP system potassium uptake protein